MVDGSGGRAQAAASILGHFSEDEDTRRAGARGSHGGEAGWVRGLLAALEGVVAVAAQAGASAASARVPSDGKGASCGEGSHRGNDERGAKLELHVEYLE